MFLNNACLIIDIWVGLMAILLKFPEEKILEGDYIIYKHGVTEEEFWEFVNEDTNCELIEGILVIHSPASEEHEDIFSYLNAILRVYLEETLKGKVYGSRFVMKLSERWNPEPDLFVVTPEKYSQIQRTYFDGPADIVIEILSKSTRELDLEKKLPHYLRAGVQEVWIIDPEAKVVTLHSSESSTTYDVPHSEKKLASKVLPEFPFQIRWLWNRDHYSVNKVLKEFVQLESEA